MGPSQMKPDIIFPLSICPKMRTLCQDQQTSHWEEDKNAGGLMCQTWKKVHPFYFPCDQWLVWAENVWLNRLLFLVILENSDVSVGRKLNIDNWIAEVMFTSANSYQLFEVKLQGAKGNQGGRFVELLFLNGDTIRLSSCYCLKLAFWTCLKWEGSSLIV